jgi:hypothetical protein
MSSTIEKGRPVGTLKRHTAPREGPSLHDLTVSL